MLCCDLLNDYKHIQLLCDENFEFLPFLMEMADDNGSLLIVLPSNKFQQFFLKAAQSISFVGSY